jgi:hypothetical protein
MYCRGCFAYCFNLYAGGMDSKGHNMVKAIQDAGNTAIIVF